jgi:hypothetical protein
MLAGGYDGASSTMNRRDLRSCATGHRRVNRNRQGRAQRAGAMGPLPTVHVSSARLETLSGAEEEGTRSHRPGAQTTNRRWGAVSQRRRQYLSTTPAQAVWRRR